MSAPRDVRDRGARRTALRLALATAAMFGFAFLLVPLYDAFCEITGLNGKTGLLEARATPTAQPPAAATPAAERWVEVEFIGRVQPGLPWQFEVPHGKLRVRVGETREAMFRVRNVGAEAVTGRAVPSVSPGLAAEHFRKIACFCFEHQPLKPGEVKDLPLRFTVDPGLPPEIGTVTLAYTFFPQRGG